MARRWNGEQRRRSRLLERLDRIDGLGGGWVLAERVDNRLHLRADRGQLGRRGEREGATALAVRRSEVLLAGGGFERARNGVRCGLAKCLLLVVGEPSECIRVGQDRVVLR